MSVVGKQPLSAHRSEAIVSIETRLHGSSDDEEPVIEREYPRGTLCVLDPQHITQRIKQFLGDDSHKKNWTRRVDVTIYNDGGERGMEEVRVYFPDETFEVWSWGTKPRLTHLLTLIFGKGVTGMRYNADMELYILRNGSDQEPCGLCAKFDGFEKRFNRSAPFRYNGQIRPGSMCHASVWECKACGAAHYNQGALKCKIPPGVVGAMQITMSNDGWFIVSDDFTEEE
jgi:hypothetical protein